LLGEHCFEFLIVVNQRVKIVKFDLGEMMDILTIDESSEEKSSVLKNVKSSLPWVEKYRPNSLSELIAHEDIINILNKLIDDNKLPHLLFHGPPGTGIKTHSSFISASHNIFILKGKPPQ
jgi:Holliday junction resolvasome RuvABC ATP-dependent DNA helicase subunit